MPTISEMEQESQANELKRSKMPLADGITKLIATLGKSVVEQHRVVDGLERQLKEATEELRYLEEVSLPQAMADIGLSSFALDDGSAIDIKDITVAHIKRDNAMAAHQWLSDHGFGTIVKDKFTIDFGKGDNEKAKAFRELLDSDTRFSNWSNKESVHSSTLKAIVREQLEKGNNDFLTEEATELLGIREFKHAKVKVGGV